MILARSGSAAAGRTFAIGLWHGGHSLPETVPARLARGARFA